MYYKVQSPTSLIPHDFWWKLDLQEFQNLAVVKQLKKIPIPIPVVAIQEKKISSQWSKVFTCPGKNRLRFTTKGNKSYTGFFRDLPRWKWWSLCVEKLIHHHCAEVQTQLAESLCPFKNEINKYCTLTNSRRALIIAVPLKVV